jgi:hypothetical protein
MFKLRNSANPILNNVLGGWQISGVARLQSGTPMYLNGLGTFDQSTTSSGVVLHNISASQLQSMMGVL